MATVEETEFENRQAAGERHRVLIAAAVAALVGGRARILEITPAEKPSGTSWKNGGVSKPVKRAALRRRIKIRTKAVRKEEQRATTDHT